MPLSQAVLHLGLYAVTNSCARTRSWYHINCWSLGGIIQACRSYCEPGRLNLTDGHSSTALINPSRFLLDCANSRQVAVCHSYCSHLSTPLPCLVLSQTAAACAAPVSEGIVGSRKISMAEKNIIRFGCAHTDHASAPLLLCASMGCDADRPIAGQLSQRRL